MCRIVCVACCSSHILIMIDFCLKRVLVRTSVLASIVFIAESVPSFGPVLDFFGGSTVALTSVSFWITKKWCKKPKSLRKLNKLICGICQKWAEWIIGLFAALLSIKTLIKVASVQVIFPCLFYLFLAAGERKSKEAAHFGIDDPPSFIEFALC